MKFEKTKTNHFFEAAVKYTGNKETKIDFFASYVFYQRQDYKKGSVFVQADYHLDYNTKLFVAYVTGPSQVNFQSKAGFPSIGVDIKRSLDFSTKFSTVAKLTVSVNPSYKTTIVPNSSIANRPFTTVSSLMF